MHINTAGTKGRYNTVSKLQGFKSNNTIFINGCDAFQCYFRTTLVKSIFNGVTLFWDLSCANLKNQRWLEQQQDPLTEQDSMALRM